MIGQTAELFIAGGLAIVGDRACGVQNKQQRSTRLRVFDVSDPRGCGSSKNSATPSSVQS